MTIGATFGQMLFDEGFSGVMLSRSSFLRLVGPSLDCEVSSDKPHKEPEPLDRLDELESSELLDGGEALEAAEDGEDKPKVSSIIRGRSIAARVAATQTWNYQTNGNSVRLPPVSFDFSVWD